SPDEIIRNLVDCVSKGGNFVLNTGPMGDGAFSPEHIALINALGAWTSANGEAIYGTEPAPECVTTQTNSFRCCATKRDHAIYLHVLQWPHDAGAPCSLQISRDGFVDGALLDSSLGTLKVTGTTENGSATTTVTFPRP